MTALRALVMAAALAAFAVDVDGQGHPRALSETPPDVEALLQHLDDLYRTSSVARIQIEVIGPRNRRSMRVKAWTRGEEEVLVLIESPARNNLVRTDIKLTDRSSLDIVGAFGAYLPYGRRPRAGILRSEFGSASLSALLQLRIYL